MNIKKLINWGELSRLLTGSRQNVRSNNIPKKYQPKVDEIMKANEDVVAKWKKE